MILTPRSLKNKTARKIRVWVLSPAVESAEENIDYYYDFSQSIAEYEKVFSELALEWKWQPVTMKNYAEIIDKIDFEKLGGDLPVVLNLCDGDEINGSPGISVVKLLEEREIIFTGADAYFYKITTSKIPMKESFDHNDVPNAQWMAILSEDADCSKLFHNIGSPVIIKPAVSGGSMGVGIKNIVYNHLQLQSVLKEMFAGYRGWNLTTDGIVAEKFIPGPEFTTLITGSYNDPENAIIHLPVERVFHSSLPEAERFLSFDRLWEIYESESAMPDNENFYEYQTPEPSLINEIKEISWKAFCATRGKGYARVDLRMDSATNRLYVLEVNAQCGLSEDENYTSIGAILKFENKTFSQLIIEILNDAFSRYGIKAKKHKIAIKRIA